MRFCLRCNNTRFVCENHPTNPWLGDLACSCGGAGMPCPLCNLTEPGNPDDEPATPDGFVPDTTRKR